MSDSSDMSTPMTRGEFAQFEIRFEQRLAQLATKAELEVWGGALLARIESGEQRLLARLLERIDSSEQRLLAELARHTRASSEDMSAQIAVIDEKYADLPPRVGRLETKVFRTKRTDH